MYFYTLYVQTIAIAQLAIENSYNMQTRVQHTRQTVRTSLHSNTPRLKELTCWPWRSRVGRFACDQKTPSTVTRAHSARSQIVSRRFVSGARYSPRIS